MRFRSWQCLLLSIFACAFLLITAQTASACSCGRRPTVLESFDESDEVVIVRVISVEKVADTGERHYVDGVRSTTMIVEKVFKGNLKIRDEIVFGQGGGADCIWTFDEKSVGHQFLFYLNRPEKLSDRRYLPSSDPGLWFAFGCGRSSGRKRLNIMVVPPDLNWDQVIPTTQVLPARVLALLNLLGRVLELCSRMRGR